MTKGGAHAQQSVELTAPGCCASLLKYSAYHFYNELSATPVIVVDNHQVP